MELQDANSSPIVRHK